MDKQLELKIEYALILIEKMYKDMYLNTYEMYQKYSPLYPFTTENLGGYFEKFDFEDKNVLTVCGSGDQVLNSILLGAKRVDTFDINEYSEMLYHLKKAAIKGLTFEEYMDYFYYRKASWDEENKKQGKAMNIKSYWKLSPYLDKVAKIFWDNLYLEKSGNDIRSSVLFTNDIDMKDVVIEVNKYLDKKNYYKLKNIIDNCKVNFIASDIKDLKNKINGSYDFIFLSNIAQYIPQYEDDYENDFNLDQLKKYKDLVMNFTSSMNDGGIMAVAYLYDYLVIENCSSNWSSIYNTKARTTVFSPNEFSYIEFSGMNALEGTDDYGCNLENKDAIMIYKK